MDPFGLIPSATEATLVSKYEGQFPDRVRLAFGKVDVPTETVRSFDKCSSDCISRTTYVIVEQTGSCAVRASDDNQAESVLSGYSIGADYDAMQRKAITMPSAEWRALYCVDWLAGRFKTITDRGWLASNASDVMSDVLGLTDSWVAPMASTAAKAFPWVRKHSGSSPATLGLWVAALGLVATVLWSLVTRLVNYVLQRLWARIAARWVVRSAQRGGNLDETVDAAVYGSNVVGGLVSVAGATVGALIGLPFVSFLVIEVIFPRYEDAVRLATASESQRPLADWYFRQPPSGLWGRPGLTFIVATVAMGVALAIAKVVKWVAVVRIANDENDRRRHQAPLFTMIEHNPEMVFRLALQDALKGLLFGVAIVLGLVPTLVAYLLAGALATDLLKAIGEARKFGRRTGN